MTTTSALRGFALAARWDGILWRRLAYAGAAYGPDWWVRRTPAAFGFLFFLLLAPQRRAVRANHRRIRPELGRVALERATLGTFVAFARCLTDALAGRGPRPPDVDVETSGEEHLEAAHAAGRGAVLVTAHLGSWELVGRLAGRKGYPITVAMARERNDSVRSFAHDLRLGDGVDVLYTGEGGFAALDLLAALRRNRLLALQLDRPTGGDADCVAPLFGVPTPFPLGPFLLAQAGGAPVLPVLSFRVGHRRYRIEVSAPVHVLRAGGAGATEAALRQVVRILEDAVRRHPEQWFHFTEIGGAGFAAPGARAPDQEMVPHASGWRAR